MLRTLTACLGLAPLLCTSCTAQRDPDAPLAGQWQSSTEVVALENKGLPPGEVARSLAEARRTYAQPNRQCRPGEPPALVAGASAGPGCTFARVADAGASVDRFIVCQRPHGLPQQTHITGTRAATRTDFTAETPILHPATGVPVGRVVLREISVRLGACPS